MGVDILKKDNHVTVGLVASACIFLSYPIIYSLDILPDTSVLHTLLLLVAAAAAVFYLTLGLSSFANYFIKLSPVISQMTRFGIVGILNTLVDLSVLNILFILFSTTAGPTLYVFKTFSFLIAVMHSYIWNNLWVFTDKKRVASKKELLLFVCVSLGGLLANILIFGLTYSYLPKIVLLDSSILINVAAMTAVFGSFAWNFVGYKYVVFKPKRP